MNEQLIWLLLKASWFCAGLGSENIQSDKIEMTFHLYSNECLWRFYILLKCFCDAFWNRVMQLICCNPCRVWDVKNNLKFLDWESSRRQISTFIIYQFIDQSDSGKFEIFSWLSYISTIFWLARRLRLLWKKLLNRFHIKLFVSQHSEWRHSSLLRSSRYGISTDLLCEKAFTK